MVVDEDACNACGACIAVCPCDALVFPNSAEQAQKVPKIAVNQAVCVLCGACTQACPVDALKVKRTNIIMTDIPSPAWKEAFDKLLK